MIAFNLVDVFIAQALQRPDRVAISTPETSVTYREVLARASQCARLLERHGITAGDRVAVALAQPDQVAIATLGCWMLDATITVLDPRTRPAEKYKVTSAFDLKAIIEPRQSRDAGHVSIAVGDDLVSMFATESDETVLPPETHHPAVIQRTSGTTGDPLGIVYSHSTYMLTVCSSRAHYYLMKASLSLHAHPLAYAAGFSRTIMPLLNGQSVFVLPMIASADEYAEKVLSLNVSSASVVPPMLHGLLALSEGRSEPLFPGIGVLAGVGAKFPAEAVLRAYHEITDNFAVSYGASLGGSISYLSGEDLLRKPDSVGRINPTSHVQIIDFEGAVLPVGESGLIRTRGPTVADTTIGTERPFADRMMGGWAIPGDTGYLDNEGFLFLTGRASDMIIRGGANVFPREVETAFEKRDDVVEAAVVGYPHESAGEEIAAFIVTKGDVTEEDLASYARTVLVPDKRPRFIRIVKDLPRNQAGKVLKRVLVTRIPTT